MRAAVRVCALLAAIAMSGCGQPAGEASVRTRGLGTASDAAPARLVVIDGPERIVNDRTVGPQTEPALCAVGDEVKAAWIDRGGMRDGFGAAEIVAARLDARGAPDASFTLSQTPPAFLDTSLALCCSGADVAVAAWGDLFSSAIRRFDADGPLGTEQDLDSDASGGVGLACGSGGEFVVASSGGGQRDVVASRFSPAGDPFAEPQQLSTAAADAVYAPVATAIADGSFVVAWEGGMCESYACGESGPDGRFSGIFARQLAADGTPLDAAERQVNSVGAGAQAQPAIAASGDGFIVAWDEVRVDDANVDFGIVARRFAADGSAAPDERLDTAGRLAFGPAVAGHSSGASVVAWEEVGRDGSDSAVVVQAYDVDGTPIGAPIQANRYTPGRQAASAVAMTGSDRFIAAWESEG